MNFMDVDHVGARRYLLFFLVTLFLCSWHLDDGTNDNTLSRALAVSGIVESGSAEITAFHDLTGDKAVVDGHYYSDKAPLPTWLVVPFWWIARSFGAEPPGSDGHSYAVLLRIGGFVCGSIPLALIITLLWKQARACGQRHAVLLAVLLAMGSFLFVYSGSFYNHLPGALFVLLASLAIQKEQITAAGIWAGAALLTDTALMVIIVAQGIQVLFGSSFKHAWRFGLGALPGLLLLLANNWVLMGSAFTFPSAMAANYPHMTKSLGFRGWSLDALYGLTFSVYRGLFIYMPALLGLVFLRSKGTWRTLLVDPLLLPAVALVLIYAGHSTWWGGWTYGPRYITASAVLLAAFMLVHLRHGIWPTRIVLVLGSIGFLCALAAKSTVWYSLPSGVLDPFGAEILPRLFEGDWNGSQWPVLLGMAPKYATLLFLLLFVAGLRILALVDRRHAPVPLS